MIIAVGPAVGCRSLVNTALKAGRMGLLDYCGRPANSQREQLRPARKQKGGRTNRRDKLATRDRRRANTLRQLVGTNCVTYRLRQALSLLSAFSIVYETLNRQMAAKARARRGPERPTDQTCRPLPLSLLQPDAFDYSGHFTGKCLFGRILKD